MKDIENNKEKKYKISIIGLGLMGASLAMALKGFKDATIIGMDIDKRVCLAARENNVTDEIYTNTQDATADADLVILCVYPHLVKEIISQNKFKCGAVITDICGVKVPLYDNMEELLPPQTDYIGIHPMAGKEVDGFDNADAALYKNSGFIIIPLQFTNAASIDLMESMAKYIGATRIATASPSLHDDIIGYTSDLMHISAAGLCVDYNENMTSAFTAGAFRDCTRIANMNAPLWTELLLSNRKYTIPHLENYISNLQKIHTAMQENNYDFLNTLLEKASYNKKEILKR